MGGSCVTSHPSWVFGRPGGSVVKPEERWMRQSAYRLKHQFPCHLSLYQNTVVGVNYTTAKKNNTRVYCFIEKAALLPSRSSRSSGPGSTNMDGLWDSRNRTFIVDRVDVPVGFKMDNNLEIVHEHKRYKATSIQVFGDEVYEIKATWLEGLPASEVIRVWISDDLAMSEVLS